MTGTQSDVSQRVNGIFFNVRGSSRFAVCREYVQRQCMFTKPWNLERNLIPTKM